MAAPEEVYSARQAADRLGLSPAMTRRYGAALEELTGEAIPQHPRDGRQYRREQLETMQRAKSYVETNPRLSVAQALMLALGAAPEVATSAALSEPGDPSGRLVEAFKQALTQALLPELRALRESSERLEREVEALRSEVSELRRLPPGATSERIDRALEVEMREGRVETEQTAAVGAAERSPDGPMVRVARWLERRLRGG